MTDAHPPALVDNLDRAGQLSDMLRAMGHPLRLRVIALLCQHEATVGEMAEQLDASQAIMSQQLRILRMSGLVNVTREGGFAYYRLAVPHLKQMIRCMEQCPLGQQRPARKGGRSASVGDDA